LIDFIGQNKRKVEKPQKIEITFDLNCDVKNLSQYKSKNLYQSSQASRI